MIYDFRKGNTAEYLLNKLKARYAKRSDFLFQRFESIPHEYIICKNNSFIYKKGENEYYMFAYKKRFSTITYGALPKYHITNCETREFYTGYYFSNQMPVRIYCADQRRDLGEKRLELCKNCHRELSYFSYGDDETDWFDVILKKAENREYTEEDLKRDGYTRDWNQVSKAYRYKKGFICDECGIDLSERRTEWFCEVHHMDHNKRNNSIDNLQCLCIRCHTNVDILHKKNYSTGNNKMKLNQFNIQFPET